MSQAIFDHAPGDIPAEEAGGPSGLLVYTIGLLLALTLTALSFWVANTHLLWAPGSALGLAVLAIAQMGVHLVFFLHITSGPDNINNALALAFGVLIVTLIVTGSLVIMNDLRMTTDTTMARRGAGAAELAVLGPTATRAITRHKSGGSTAPSIERRAIG